MLWWSLNGLTLIIKNLGSKVFINVNLIIGKKIKIKKSRIDRKI